MEDTQLRYVQAHEMFFSLTDARGVITGANSVFARISRYEPDELLGAPHNIVRSSEMPGGVFRLMWDIIQAGRPFAGYVQSAASDGKKYWVFATITPVPHGYLSVRTAPCVDGIHQTIVKIYRNITQIEQRARANGSPRRLAAEIGRDALLGELAKLGYGAYEDFMAALLPAEVAERSRRGTRPLNPRLTTDSRLLEIREAGTVIGHESATLLQHIERYRNLADGLRQSARDASAGAQSLAEATTAARAASSVVASQAPTVLSTALAMERGGAAALRDLQQLASRLDVDLKLLRGLQIRIALAKLHADMAVNFVDDLPGADPRLGLNYAADLCLTLDSTVRLLSNAMGAHSTNMSTMVETIEEICSSLGQFQDFLFMWRSLLIRYGVTSDVAVHLAPIDQQLRDGFTQVVALRILARQCLAEAKPYDASQLLHPLHRLEQAIASPAMH